MEVAPSSNQKKNVETISSLAQDKLSAVQEESYILFYSSETEPEILSCYGKVFSYLKSQHKNVHIVDVYRNPQLPERFGITSTPVLIIQKGNKRKELFGIVHGLEHVLKRSLLGDLGKKPKKKEKEAKEEDS